MRLGVDGILLHLRAEPLDVDVQGLGVAHVVGAPHPVDERVAGEDAAGVVEQQLQQLELLQRQRHGLAPDHDLVAVGVEPDVAHLEHAVALVA